MSIIKLVIAKTPFQHYLALLWIGLMIMASHRCLPRVCLTCLPCTICAKFACWFQHVLMESAYLLTYLLTYFFFDLFVACGRCHCLWEMGVACFSCMHTIRAEAGLCLLVPAMFASQSYGLHNLFVFLFGVYRDQNTGVEERWGTCLSLYVT
jgi:hypothetical protein